MQANLLQLSVQLAQARVRYENVDYKLLLRLSRFGSESSFVSMWQVLAAILGEMHQTSGRVVSRGTIAYCAQQPWLISGTLRDNV